MRVLLIEPPKGRWFTLGQYAPPPFDKDYRRFKQRTPFLIPNSRAIPAALVMHASTALSHSTEQDGRLRRLNMLSLVLTLVAILCLFLAAALTLLSKAAEPYPSKQFAGLFFCIICLFGATAAVVPSKCSQPLHHKQDGAHGTLWKDASRPDRAPIALRGHHPTCESFASHVFRFRDNAYCAGCLGLLAGAVSAIVGSLIYFLDLVNVGNVATVIFWLGFSGVFAGLCQYAKPFVLKASIHFLMNLIFVLGVFFLLTGTIEINGSAASEAYVLVATVYWIFTRIILSQCEHQKTCAACRSGPCTHFQS